MRGCRRWVVSSLLIIVVPAAADQTEGLPTIVVDTDVGLDDVVTLAMVLQSPQVNVAGIVVCEGVTGRERGVIYLERLLDAFNRRDIPLYGAAKTASAQEAPAFRRFAQKVLDRALPEKVAGFHRPFSPDVYEAPPSRKKVVLALGPLTNLAAALTERSAVENGLAKIIISGPPEASRNWNIAYDADALGTVRAAGVPIESVTSGTAGRKPEAWRHGDWAPGPGTSVGERFWCRLLATAHAREHYAKRLPDFTDELVFLYYVDDTLFGRDPSSENNVVTVHARNHRGICDAFARLMCEGRQGKTRVVFVDARLPSQVFRPDIRLRQTRIIAKNGEAEWFAQVLMNELHEHLGIYSVIGVKMGLRAAELLNAPQHAMQVVSRAASQPPVSCLNDGIIVASGSTPGRALFRKAGGAADSTRVEFTYNWRRITLDIKGEYRERISKVIGTLREQHTLADPRYWEGVRREGIRIWENWHRRDLFEIVETRDVRTQPAR